MIDKMLFLCKVIGDIMFDEEKYYTIMNNCKDIKKKTEKYFYGISEHITLGVSLSSGFMVIGDDFHLYYSQDDLKTIIFSEFYGKYRLKKNRPFILEEIANVINSHKHEIYQFIKIYSEWEDIKFSMDDEEIDRRRHDDKWDEWE